MKKVLVLTTTYPRWQGDTEPAFVHNLSRELIKSCDVTVLAPHTRGSADSEELDGVRIRRFRYLPVGWQRLAYDGGIVPKLKQNRWMALQIPFLFFFMFVQALLICRREKVDVIHAHWLIPQGLIAVVVKKLLGGRVKVITTSHGADLYSLKAGFLQKLKRWVISQSDMTTVVSNAMKSFCEQELAIDQSITVQAMGIDCQNTFVNRMPSAERQGIVFVGRLVEKKGCGLLISAFASLLEIYPDQSLTIVGDGFDRVKLEQQVKALGIESSVTFVGAVNSSEVADYYNRAVIAVMPSMIAEDGDQEGLGLVAGESLACGCITVTSDLPAIQDVHQQPLLQFAAGDSDCLHQRLLWVSENQQQAEQLAQELSQKVIAEFDWQAVGERYQSFIQQL